MTGSLTRRLQKKKFTYLRSWPKQPGK